jgi:hypothetical protein
VDENLKLFLNVEIKKIEIDKWDEGVRRHNDPGNDFVLEWVERNAKQFRYQWDISVCKCCEKCYACGYNLLSACDGYINTTE